MNVTIRDPLIPHTINSTIPNNGFVKNELGIVFPVGEGYPELKKANVDLPNSPLDFDDIELSQFMANINQPGAVNKLDGNADSYLGGDGKFHTSEYLEKLATAKVESKFQTQLDALRALNEEKSHRIYGVDIDLNNSDPYSRVTYTDDAVGFVPMRYEDSPNSIISHLCSFVDVSYDYNLLKFILLTTDGRLYISDSGDKWAYIQTIEDDTGVIEGIYCAFTINKENGYYFAAKYIKDTVTENSFFALVSKDGGKNWSRSFMTKDINTETSINSKCVYCDGISFHIAGSYMEADGISRPYIYSTIDGTSITKVKVSSDYGRLKYLYRVDTLGFFITGTSEKVYVSKDMVIFTENVLPEHSKILFVGYVNYECICFTTLGPNLSLHKAIDSEFWESYIIDTLNSSAVDGEILDVAYRSYCTDYIICTTINVFRVSDLRGYFYKDTMNGKDGWTSYSYHNRSTKFASCVSDYKIFLVGDVLAEIMKDNYNKAINYITPTLYNFKSCWNLNDKIFICSGKDADIAKFSFAYSDDGYFFYRIDIYNTDGLTCINSMTFNGTRYIAVGVGSRCIAASDDGIIWEHIATAKVNEIYYIGYNSVLDERFMLCIGALGTILFSRDMDAYIWTDVSNLAVTESLRHYIFHKKSLKFIVVGDNATILEASINLNDIIVNFIKKGNMAPGQHNVTKIVQIDSVDTEALAISTNGVTYAYYYDADNDIYEWAVQYALSTGVDCLDVSYSDGMFVIVGTQQMISTSPNHSDWQARYLYEENEDIAGIGIGTHQQEVLFKVFNYDGIWYVVSTSGAVFKLADGLTSFPTVIHRNILYLDQTNLNAICLLDHSNIFMCNSAAPASECLTIINLNDVSEKIFSYGTWEDIFKSLIGCRPCLVGANARITYIDEYDFSKCFSGKISDYAQYDPDIMIEFNKFYYKFSKSKSSISFKIANFLPDKEYSDLAFREVGSAEYSSGDHLYIGAYRSSLNNARVQSLIGFDALKDFSFYDFGNYGGNHGMLQYYRMVLLEGLMWLFGKSTDIINTFGNRMPTTNIKTGCTKNAGLFSYGSSKQYPKIFGIENLFGTPLFVNGFFIFDDTIDISVPKGNVNIDIKERSEKIGYGFDQSFFLYDDWFVSDLSVPIPSIFLPTHSNSVEATSVSHYCELVDVNPFKDELLLIEVNKSKIINNTQELSYIRLNLNSVIDDNVPAGFFLARSIRDIN